jgi:uncharacterized protein
VDLFTGPLFWQAPASRNEQEPHGNGRRIRRQDKGLAQGRGLAQDGAQQGAALPRSDIYRILDAALLCHVAYTIDGQPYCTPTAFWREGDRLFWHGSSASRMLRNLAKGIPACLTVCHVDGIVLSRSAFHHSINYRSVMAFGTAQLVDDAQEKADALRSFVNRYFPGRYEAIKQPNAQEVKGTTIISMRIEEASAKTRSGPPRDDEADYSLPIWVGVVPVQTVVGEIVECPRQHGEARRGEDIALYRRGRRLDEVLTEAGQDGACSGGKDAPTASKSRSP